MLKIPTDSGRSTTAFVETRFIIKFPLSGGDPLQSQLLDAAGGACATREPALQAPSALTVHDSERFESDPSLSELVGVRVVLAACGWVEQLKCFACSPPSFKSTCEHECASHSCAILANEHTFGAFVASPSTAIGLGLTAACSRA